MRWKWTTSTTRTTPTAKRAPPHRGERSPGDDDLKRRPDLKRYTLVGSCREATEGSLPMTHPLDPLGEEEIVRASAIASEHLGSPASLRFPLVAALEPPKGALDAPRSAEVLCFDTASGLTTEVVVDLDAGRVAVRHGPGPACSPSPCSRNTSAPRPRSAPTAAGEPPCPPAASPISRSTSPSSTSGRPETSATSGRPSTASSKASPTCATRPTTTPTADPSKA